MKRYGGAAALNGSTDIQYPKFKKQEMSDKDLETLEPQLDLFSSDKEKLAKEEQAAQEREALIAVKSCAPRFCTWDSQTLNSGYQINMRLV